MTNPQADFGNGSVSQVLFQDVLYRSANHQFELMIGEFRVLQGEKVAVTGPSGSGKTTLLSLISGYRTAERGQIEVLGRPLCELNEKEREDLRIQQMGIVFQDFRLIDYLSVRENLSLSSFLSPVEDNLNIRDRVDAIADQLHLQSLLDRYPSQLSQGECQRTAIGRAIFQNPSLILADEPTGNLDPETAAKTLDYLFRVIDVCHSTLVMVTHDYSLLSRFNRHHDMTELCQKTSAQH